MKKRVTCLIVLLSWMVVLPLAHAGFGDFLEELKSALTQDGDLSKADIVKGLKQALDVGTRNAVALVSKTDGYFKNPQIKIPLPENVQKVEKLLKTFGFGKEVDAFELSMNRAAERAAPLAVDVFKKAITRMSFSDARRILDGPDDAATTYFKGATFERLQTAFKPIITRAMADVGVTRSFQNLNKKLAAMPLTQQLSFDLDQYTTDKSLDGLFHMLAIEEKKIRKDPAARVTDLLKKVFGKK